jgi:hypothetical protein
VQLDHRVPGQALVVLGDEREAARLEDLHVAAPPHGPRRLVVHERLHARHALVMVVQLEPERAQLVDAVEPGEGDPGSHRRASVRPAT